MPTILFTKENASEFAKRGNSVKWGLKNKKMPDERLIRARLYDIERLMRNAANSQTYDQLSRAYERMFRVWCYIVGLPSPGSRRPAPEPRKKAVVEDVSPSVPAALDLLRETE